MASRSYRDMAAAVGFAGVFSRQLKDYYQKEKPRAKRVVPIIDRVIEAAEKQLFHFRKELTVNDVFRHISDRVDKFNATTGNSMDEKEATAFIIGMLAERINELNMKGSRSGHLERLESVLKPLEELYEYFDVVNRSDVEEDSFKLFNAWEAA